MVTEDGSRPPILRDKQYEDESQFTPESLVHEARRQKALREARVPQVCILDPDGDIVRYLRATGRARLDLTWACYHSELFRFEEGGREYGIVGCAVGASYAVLVAEQMFAAGCGLLLSVTSSGQITPRGSPPYFILIDRALRDDLYQAMIARSQCASSKESIEPKGVYCRLYGKANKPFNAMIPQRPLRPYSDFQNLT